MPAPGTGLSAAESAPTGRMAAIDHILWTTRYLVVNWQTKAASVAQIIAVLASPRT